MRLPLKFPWCRSAQGFRPVELCNLDYCPSRGAAIAPHKDDAWLWGERLATVTLRAGTVLTFSRANVAVRVALPARSLVVVAGDARYGERCVNLLCTWISYGKERRKKSR